MIYLDLFPQLEEYSNAEVGELVFAMREYVEFGAVPQFEDRGLRVIWRGVQDRLNRDYKRYVEEVEKRRIDGLYGHYVKICKARGEKPKEKVLWMEEDLLPTIKDTQESSNVGECTQVYLSPLEGRKPTTTSNAKSDSPPSPYETGTTSGKGFGGRKDSFAFPSIEEGFTEEMRQAAISKLDKIMGGV